MTTAQIGEGTAATVPDTQEVPATAQAGAVPAKARKVRKVRAAAVPVTVPDGEAKVTGGESLPSEATALPEAKEVNPATVPAVSPLAGSLAAQAEAGAFLSPEAKEVRRLARLNADLQAENNRLQMAQLSGEPAKVAGEPESKPVSDSQLASGFRKLYAATKKTPEKPAYSLVSALGFRPDMTDEQKAKWKAMKAKIAELHTAWMRETWPTINGHLVRGFKNPENMAKAAGAIRKRKDGSVRKVSASVDFKNPNAGGKPAKGTKKSVA